MTTPFLTSKPKLPTGISAMMVISPSTDLHNTTSLRGKSTVSTNSSISFTSVHASLPGTCSPITLSIELENVTSTMIQLKWRPLGSTRGSPYTVRLWRGSRVAEEKSINETSTAFQNLFPDHEFQIFVDVLTCSKNVSTSMTVRTAAEVFNGTTRIISEDFIPEYQNKSSTAFKEFETKFIKEIEERLPKDILKLIKEGKMHIIINSLRNGSVIVDFNIVLDVGNNITKREISDAFMNAFNMSRALKVDLKETFIEARNSCWPGLNDCSKHAICTAEGGSYSCQCKEGFTDNSLQVPGRVCQQKQNLPSQHMTTVPPESAIVRFTGSTANSILTTAFGSRPCMPVSIEVQNVTGEAIQFGWTLEGGRRGSLYIASLMDGNREINKTTTNETKTMFNHLLPGHVYTISVAVLSCAENSRTSVSVRTDPASCFSGTEFCTPQNRGCTDLKHTVCSNYQAFACSVFLKTQMFNHMLYNSDSEDYKTMSESIKTEVVRQMQMKLEDDHFDIVMLGFRPGSVIAYFVFLLQKQEFLDVNILQAYLSDILKSKFGNQTEVTVQSLSAQSSPGESRAWKVAVIVLGVLLGVALVLLFLITLAYIYMKKSSVQLLEEPC
nr:uncharacterized protein LOC112981976 [Dromaius novaehollandiae]